VRSEAIRDSLQYSSFNWPASTPDDFVRDADIHLKQPGDIIAILRPTDDDDLSRILLVHRFIKWRGERDRFVLYVPATAHLPGSDATALTDELLDEIVRPLCSRKNRILNVTKVELIEKRPTGRGPSKFEKIPVTGKLASQENYAIYRCSLFIDGFSSSIFTSAHYHGIYLQPLSIPSESRVDPASSRVLTLVPPGVKVGKVVKHIVSDLMTSYRVGRRTTDSSGAPLTIFIDLVNLVGDTPGMNAFLDVKGHNSTAFCHRCRYSRTFKPQIRNAYLQRWTVLCPQRRVGPQPANVLLG